MTGSMMTVEYLRNVIKNLPDEIPVYVACNGLCNYNFKEKRPREKTDTFAIVWQEKMLVITDECSVDVGNGESI